MFFLIIILGHPLQNQNNKFQKPIMFPLPMEISQQMISGNIYILLNVYFATPLKGLKRSFVTCRYGSVNKFASFKKCDGQPLPHSWVGDIVALYTSSGISGTLIFRENGSLKSLSNWSSEIHQDLKSAQIKKTEYRLCVSCWRLILSHLG